MTAPVCECHGESMTWDKDARKRSGGYWRCRVRRSAWDRAFYAANPEKKRRAVREYDHGPGYAKRRRRELAAQRRAVLDKLAELRSQEATLA